MRRLLLSASLAVASASLSHPGIAWSHHPGPAAGGGWWWIGPVLLLAAFAAIWAIWTLLEKRWATREKGSGRGTPEEGP